MVSPCLIFGQSSRAGPPYRLPVWWSSAVEEDVATFTGEAARSYFSSRGTMGVPEKCIVDDLPHTRGCVNCYRAWEMEKMLSLPIVCGACSKYIYVSVILVLYLVFLEIQVFFIN